MAFKEVTQENPDFYLCYSSNGKLGAVFPAKPEIAAAFARAGFTKMTPILFWVHNTNKKMRYREGGCDELLFIWAEIQAMFRDFTFSDNQLIAFGWWLSHTHTENNNFHNHFLPYYSHNNYHISKAHAINIEAVLHELKPAKGFFERVLGI
ncbi:hypothetical protein HN385_00115 [archaeon]|jgi:hypothetical protein|nr:hypothetical protein [archaeon]MBT3451241.1 hypothetical protein [archaeon]MBT6869030.1 hypothetical protein [archaeon]MBT7193618.1 hypothetical protein [archaeon]MBT7380151.1 hypothetical protein [archaeon]